MSSSEACILLKQDIYCHSHALLGWSYDMHSMCGGRCPSVAAQHLDDVCPKVGQQGSAEIACDDLPNIQDLRDEPFEAFSTVRCSRNHCRGSHIAVCMHKPEKGVEIHLDTLQRPTAGSILVSIGMLEPYRAIANAT